VAQEETLAWVRAAVGTRELTAALVRRVSQSQVSWDIDLLSEGQVVLSGGYDTDHLGGLALGERGPTIRMDVEDEDEDVWSVSATSGRSESSPTAESDLRSCVGIGESGYWVAITLTPLSEH
jgi:hypothetical protein